MIRLPIAPGPQLAALASSLTLLTENKNRMSLLSIFPPPLVFYNPHCIGQTKAAVNVY